MQNPKVMVDCKSVYPNKISIYHKETSMEQNTY